jgi:DNA/RNA endonuclease YhcR with UshA esterase domain
MRRTARTLLVLSLFLSSAVADDKPPRLIPASEAKSHVDETCVVEMTVRASKNAVNRKVCFLDSGEDFKDARNFAVVISYDHADKFKEAGVDDPSEYYRGKTVRVTGKVIREDDQTRIRVENPKQIQLVEERKDQR